MEERYAVLCALRCEWTKRDGGWLCAQAMEERASAQVRIAAAEDTATQAFEEVGNMRDEVADLKERLTKVCQSFLALISLDPSRPRFLWSLLQLLWSPVCAP